MANIYNYMDMNGNNGTDAYKMVRLPPRNYFGIGENLLNHKTYPQKLLQKESIHWLHSDLDLRFINKLSGVKTYKWNKGQGRSFMGGKRDSHLEVV